jgi:hypothetical protein
VEGGLEYLQCRLTLQNVHQAAALRGRSSRVSHLSLIAVNTTLF